MLPYIMYKATLNLLGVYLFEFNATGNDLVVCPFDNLLIKVKVK